MSLSTRFRYERPRLLRDGSMTSVATEIVPPPFPPADTLLTRPTTVPAGWYGDEWTVAVLARSVGGGLDFGASGFASSANTGRAASASAAAARRKRVMVIPRSRVRRRTDRTPALKSSCIVTDRSIVPPGLRT